jgi:hypothetical protein
MHLQHTQPLPDSTEPNLILSHPTPKECIAIWSNTATSWKDSLTPALFLEESLYMTTVPLAKDCGMTIWILVNRDSHPDNRIIYSSCETFRKDVLVSDKSGKTEDAIVHGIASVFCQVKLRGRGYAARMMRELIPVLYKWQTETKKCVGTTLYSDIGRRFYADLGWSVSDKNTQVEIKPEKGSWLSSAKRVMDEDLEELCRRDEALVRRQMSEPSEEVDVRFCVVPDLDHMKWHHAKEDFATKYLFEKTPETRGVIVGEPGNQMWATWTRRYYSRHDIEDAKNVLYILRLVMESDGTARRLPKHAAVNKDTQRRDKVQHLRAILEAAQAEAAEWHLDVVQLWDPSPLVLDLLPDTGIEYEVVERQNESIASLFWYNESGQKADTLPLWVNNEHYAWQ